MRIHKTSVLVLVSLFSSPIAAAIGQAQEPPPTVGVAAPPPSPSSVDPNLDRGFLLPTAMTQPEGTLTYNNYELLLHGFTYGISDRLQVSATVLSPIVKEMPFLGTVSLKAKVASVGRLHLSLQGSAGWIHEFDSTSFDEEDAVGDAFVVGAGALASLCLSDDCASLLSGSATYQLGFGGDIDSRAHLLLYGASLVQRVGTHVKLLFELTSGAGKDGESAFDNAPGLLASYGVRFYSGNIAGDIGFIKPVVTDDELSDAFLLGVPFVNVSYRW
jgi:hypothetical protein